MLKYFAIAIFICIAASSVAQNIDSLKTILPSLQDTARIDCLNEIIFYYISAQDKHAFEYYTTLAYSESKKVNYAHGIAVTLAQRANFQKHFGNDSIAQILAVESLH